MPLHMYGEALVWLLFSVRHYPHGKSIVNCGAGSDVDAFHGNGRNIMKWDLVLLLSVNVSVWSVAAILFVLYHF